MVCAAWRGRMVSSTSTHRHTVWMLLAATSGRGNNTLLLQLDWLPPLTMQMEASVQAVTWRTAKRQCRWWTMRTTIRAGHPSSWRLVLGCTAQAQAAYVGDRAPVAVLRLRTSRHTAFRLMLNRRPAFRTCDRTLCARSFPFAKATSRYCSPVLSWSGPAALVFVFSFFFFCFLHCTYWM